MSKISLPALLGGVPAFESKIPITVPTLPPGQELWEEYREVIKSGMITNAKFVSRLESEMAEYFGTRHVVAVSSCTSGLLLVLKAMDLRGNVVVPSFTFSATGHVLQWNGLRPKFVDVSEGSFNVDPERVDEAIDEDTCAILAVHLFGNPCDVQGLQKAAQRNGLRLLFDSAHALGSEYQGRKIGVFGEAEVFSLSPTKLVVGGEGGVVATDDALLARRVRIGRDYGNPGNYDCECAGLSARMGEFHGILASWSLRRVEDHVKRRNRLAARYRSLLRDLPGISFQCIRADCRTTYKDFAILVNQDSFGLTRDMLAAALEAENIASRKYFYPPLHMQQAYSELRDDCESRLPTTAKVSGAVLCLPMFSHMEASGIEKICTAIHRINDFREEIIMRLGQGERSHGS